MKKLFNSVKEKIRDFSVKAVTALTDTRGEIATNTIGGIILGVVIVGILVISINSFFPNFFTEMFNNMKTKLNSNW